MPDPHFWYAFAPLFVLAAIGIATRNTGGF